MLLFTLTVCQQYIRIDKQTQFLEKLVKPSDEFDNSVSMAKFNTSQYYLERSVRAFGEMRRLFFRQIRTY